MNTTNSLLMDIIDLLWDRPEVHLVGINSDNNGSYSKEIDRDQAVDDDGKAVFGWYALSVDVSTSDEIAPDWRDYEFTVEDIETFARTW